MAEIAAQTERKKKCVDTSKSSESVGEVCREENIFTQSKGQFVGRVFPTLLKWGCEVYGSTKQERKRFLWLLLAKKKIQRGETNSQKSVEEFFLFEGRGKNFLLLKNSTQ